MKVTISTESIILSLVCLADMVSTLYLVAIGAAVEVNPIMAACLDAGPAIFILAKLASFIPFVVATELYKRKNPAFVRAASRAAIAVYLAAYIILTAKVNFA